MQFSFLEFLLKHYFNFNGSDTEHETVLIGPWPRFFILFFSFYEHPSVSILAFRHLSGVL